MCSSQISYICESNRNTRTKLVSQSVYHLALQVVPLSCSPWTQPGPDRSTFSRTNSSPAPVSGGPLLLIQFYDNHNQCIDARPYTLNLKLLMGQSHEILTSSLFINLLLQVFHEFSELYRYLFPKIF